MVFTSTPMEMRSQIIWHLDKNRMHTNTQHIRVVHTNSRTTLSTHTTIMHNALHSLHFIAIMIRLKCIEHNSQHSSCKDNFHFIPTTGSIQRWLRSKGMPNILTRMMVGNWVRVWFQLSHRNSSFLLLSPLYSLFGLFSYGFCLDPLFLFLLLSKFFIY